MLNVARQVTLDLIDIINKNLPLSFHDNIKYKYIAKM